MQLKQDIKGFTILELLVVVVIIAVVSAVGYPNFLEWRKDREIRAAAEKVASMLTGISTQAQRGAYPFVQFEVTPSTGSVQFNSKGMLQDTMNSKLNQSNTKILDCKIANSGYWDNDTVDTYTKEVGVHIGTSSADNGAVCFSRDGSFFGEKNKLNDSTNSNQINLNLEGRNTNNYLIICPASSSGGGSMSVGSGSGSCGSLKPQYLVEWSRFGNIKKFKWSGSAWTRQ